MRYSTPSFACAGLALLLAACGGGGGGGSNPPGPGPGNTAPTANAGPAQTVTSGVTVTLNGSLSSDANGTIATYAWTQTAGAAVTLSSTTVAQPTFVAPAVVAVATFTFSLTVTDNQGATSTASTVTITVNPPAVANVPPTANAGSNQTVNSGVTVTLNGTLSTDPDGTLFSYAWTQTAGTPAVTLSNANTAQPIFAAPAVVSATTLTFSLVVTDNLGAASTASTVTVTVNPPVAGNTIVVGRVRFERVPFSAAFPFGLTYGNAVLQNVRGVVIRALDAATPATVHATGFTDDQGNYVLSVPNNTNITLQVEARLRRTASPTWDIRVQDGTAGNTPYLFTDTQINSSSGTRNIDIPTGINTSGTATGARASGPFAILDSIYQGLQTILAVAPNTNFPVLVVDWGSQVDGTFFSTALPQHIALLADLTEDTDEFDQHVIAHEFGHYLEHNFSRADNIGGSHSLGDRLDPRVAFGEGFGYAFAAIVLNDTNARDSFNDNGTQRSGGFNIETNPTTPANGGDGIGCWCSESSVWSILWDINDNAADANDTVALGFRPIWSVLTGPQRTTPAFTTIFSFITALKQTNAGASAQIDTLVAAQNITTAGMDAFGTTETNSPLTPSSNALPIYTTITAGAPVVVRNVDDLGNYNKVGNHRFLRFVAATTGLVQVSLTSSNPNNPDPDFQVWRAGTLMTLNSEDPPPQPEIDSFPAVAGTTYVIDVHDCANGCSTVQGVAGDYDLTVTIN